MNLTRTLISLRNPISNSFRCLHVINRHVQKKPARSELIQKPWIMRRSMTIETSIDEKTFETLAEETLDLLNERLENLIEELDSNNSDIVLNSGVITLSLGEKGTFVINKQTPNRQIWLSSPISGPKRYDYVDGKWVYKHNGETLDELLKQELGQLYSRNVEF